MDKTFYPGSSVRCQGHSINNPEDRIHQPSSQYSDYALMKNYCNMQHVNVTAQCPSDHQSANQRSSSHLQAMHKAVPRVHINPNFRPKPNFGAVTSTNTSQHSRVHINPHWRGRVEAATETALKPQEQAADSSSGSSSGKTTIFVNPKVLPHLSLKPSNLAEVKGSFSYHQVISSQTKSDLSANAPTHPESNFSNFLQTEISAEKSQKEFNVEINKMLVHEPPQKSSRNILDRSTMFSNSLQPKTEKVCQRKTGLFNTIDVKMQTNSKYKLVRNSSPNANSKLIREQSCSSLKRLRRRRSGSIPMSSSKSVYKFVRSLDSSNSNPKQTDPRSLKYIAETNLSLAEKRSGFGNINVQKNVKSKYKLIKIPQAQKCQDALQPAINKPKMAYTKYKLIRPCSPSRLSTKKNMKKFMSPIPGFPIQSQATKSRFKINKTSMDNRTNLARRVSRFRIVSTSSNCRPQTKKLHSLVKFNRSEHNPNLLNSKFKKLAVFGNRCWNSDKPSLSSRNLSKLPPQARSNQRSKRSVITASKSSNKSLVNIGGVLYRSTRTSLTRTHSNEAKEPVLNIRGKKFVFDEKGTVLRPKFEPGDTIPSSKMKSSISRIDIGGVTFTRRSDNTLVRTNSHFARNVLSVAKMRSIAFLRGKNRKINQPCLIYQRFGKCHAHEAGKCWRLHNPKNISICKKFLQGNCEAENCLLSHDVGPEKMPTCHYFLEGCCVRDNCPYLHVKLSSQAAICREFLNGYCAAGDMCKKRHIFICPDFEQLGKCSKGKYCPYPHKSTPKISIQNEIRNNSVCKKKKKAEKIVKDIETNKSGVDDAEKRKRYYDESKKQILDQTNSNQLAPGNDAVASDEDSDGEEDATRARIRTKIGILPAYIPLE